jgi:uncharacterized protein (TIGR00299 family) protein
MQKIAYLQCSTGIAGDMFLGALVSAGVPLDYLIQQLQRLNLTAEYQLTSQLVEKQGQTALKIEVNLTDKAHHHHRHLPAIEKLIKQANFTSQVTEMSLAIFRRLAEAEGKVHGIEPEQVHFHEVGATDALVDIIGTCLGLDYLAIEQLYCSPLPTGGGLVKAAHGLLPVPVPAVLELWQTRQVPVYSNGIDQELVTPTGAAIVTSLATDFGQPPGMKLTKIGLGAGKRDLPIPNILRLWLGEKETEKLREMIAVLETQIDDCNPQIFGYLLEELFKVGVKDAFTQPLGMKKNRPGILLTVICDVEQINICEQIIFRETTTLGIRRQIQTRSILDREIVKVTTKYGDVSVKVGKQDQKIINIQPEYEDCVNLARQHKVAVQVIAFEASKRYREQFNFN